MTTELSTTRDELVGRLERHPFVPFVLELADGSRHFVLKARMMALGMTVGTIALPMGDGPRHIALSEIVNIRDA